MNNKVYKTLEYNKIIEQLSSFAYSSIGKDLCNNLEPYTDYNTIVNLQKETSEALTMIIKKGSLPMRYFQDIKPSLNRLKLGGSLNMQELLNMSQVLDCAAKAKQYNNSFVNNEDAIHHLDSLFEVLQPLTNLNSEIKRCIISDEEMSDNASSELRSIRRSIKNINDRIRENLNNIINSSNGRTMLQENVITMRNNRYCLPVKQEYRQQFPGMIHDQSSTGSTLFIEPMSVVKMNNDIKELLGKEQEEIERVLALLSNEAAENIEALHTNVETLGQLDFIFAKASYSNSLNCSEPQFNTDRKINIKKGRHPLLAQDEVVPIDIYLGDDFSMLIITGPNTGGKTVSLKTLGLLTLMGQSGLHIPAFDGSELSVFNNVFADIGDEQSIEQSLSTFSSHMSNIINILQRASVDSLVLFDELGAGTDPTEGAALAMSILQYLHDNDIRTVATTHYSELKVFALSTQGIENGSCEFDVKTLKPTYKLLIGVPGKSNAFAISNRLGLPNHIIDNAKALIGHQDKQFEDLITDLEINKKFIEKEKQTTQKYREEVEQLKQELEDRKEKIQAQKEDVLKEAKINAHKILQEAKDFADESIRKFNKWQKDSPSINQSMLEKERQDVRKRLSNIEKGLSTGLKAKTNAPSPKKNFKAGDKVFVSAFNQEGIVLKEANNKGDVFVQIGIIKTSVHFSNLSLVQESANHTTSKGKGSVNKQSITKSASIKPELDLRGYLVDDALTEVEKYIDDGFLSNIGQVTIIHGKGTGALRDAIHAFLKRNKHIKSYRLGKFGEGESGVTIVEFK
ncbi:DNA mismatch repair protein MutS2 [Natranaerovirga hydrolytica]|uniref:Endonuclease MutS2 n=1 Tax=Natranaerovirga hydrolytica TaxID=680378 RepID=A0A4R1M9I6_9FIRM|nr:endonuclease MutS2 [Natranaerovirga hydrolytica]TCK89038.1 DNA mismatch repair protein MutS2 [Natranaerovirga hydrolytica]